MTLDVAKSFLCISDSDCGCSDTGGSGLVCFQCDTDK